MDSHRSRLSSLDNQSLCQSSSIFLGESQSQYAPDPSQMSKLSRPSSNLPSSLMPLNQRKTGGYSKMAQMKQQQKNQQVLEQLEREKAIERQKLKEYKQVQAQRERRLAEERIREAQIQNQRI